MLVEFILNVYVFKKFENDIILKKKGVSIIFVEYMGIRVLIL